MRQAGSTSLGGAVSWRFLAPVIFSLAGLLFATSESTSGGADLRGDRKADLPVFIQDLNQRNDASERAIQDLRSQVRQLDDGMAHNQRLAGVLTQVRALESRAGLEPAVGPGLSVTLDDAPPAAANRQLPGLNKPSPDDLVVHQQDVQAVVNALWTGGAEAMQIMDQRVISTSAIRCVGNTLILQGRVYSPPYTVTVIGDEARMRAALGAASQIAVYRQYVEAYGLAYQIERKAKVRLPGYSGLLDLQHARVASP